MKKLFSIHYAKGSAALMVLLLGAWSCCHAEAKKGTAAPALEPPVASSSTAVETVSTAPITIAIAPPVLPPELEQALGDLVAGRASAAEAQCSRYLSKNPKSSAGWTLLGRAQLAQNHYKSAVKSLTRALKYDPENTEAYYWKGKAYEGLGKLDEAANEYQAAVHADPANMAAQEAFKKLDESVSKN